MTSPTSQTAAVASAQRGAPLAATAASQAQQINGASSQMSQSPTASLNNNATPASSGQPSSPPPPAAAPAPGAGAASASGSTTQTPGLAYPALHLLPLNDTFVPKQISLSPPGSRVKIGRQTNAKTVPSATNGFFDSKVLSRMHAEVWSEDGKIYIKDVKSSNGTFINGDRLSPESAESDAFELHSEDIVEFGIDIVSDDNKTIVHHKVSTKVHLAVNAEEAVALMKNLPALYRMHDTALHRRPSKAGLSFDHVFSRLQTELHKSRETGSELGGLTTTMAEIHDTLGGGIPPPLSAFPPATRGAAFNQAAAKGLADPQALALLQAQLTDTQASLAGHADKVRGLETLLVDHDSIKNEVSALRDTMQTTKRELEHIRNLSSAVLPNGINGVHGSEAEESDDASSIASGSTLRARSAAHANDFDEHSDLAGQNRALVTRLEDLSLELREAVGLSQRLLAQNEAASSTVQALEARVAQLEQASEESRATFEAWKNQYETDWHQDRADWAADRQRLQAAIEEWEQTGRLESAAGNPSSLPNSEESQSSRTTDVRIPTPAGLGSVKKKRSRSPEKASTSSPTSGSEGSGAALAGEGDKLASEENWLPTTGDLALQHRDAARVRATRGRPADQRRTAAASLPIAGSIGLLAVGVVWILANRE